MVATFLQPAPPVDTGAPGAPVGRRATFAVGGADPGAAKQKPRGRVSSVLTGRPAKGGLFSSSVSTQFRSQLQVLMNKISSTQPHFVRCIKPNQRKYRCVSAWLLHTP